MAHASDYTTILPPRGILLIAVPSSPLPVFFSKEDRPAYVPESVTAIFPAHLETGASFYHTCIVDHCSDLGGLFSVIAAEYAAEIEREAHELSRLDEMAHMGYAENQAV